MAIGIAVPSATPRRPYQRTSAMLSTRLATPSRRKTTARTEWRAIPYNSLGEPACAR